MSSIQQILQNQQEKVLGNNSKGENNNQPPHTNYDDFTKAELIKHLKSKDKIINELKQTLKHQKKPQKEKEKAEKVDIQQYLDQINSYKQQLEEQYKHNQKAVKSFQQITQTIVKIIKQYQFIDQATRETVKNVVEGIRETHGKPFKQQNQNESDEDSESSQFSCIQQIVNQTSKLLQYLSVLTDENVSYVLRLRQELALTKDKLQKMSSYEPAPVRQPNEEIRSLNEEVTKLTIDKKNLAVMLQQNELDRMKILTSISTILSEEMIAQLIKLPNSELIQQIRRLTYRIRELQRDKEQIYKKSKADREFHQKKFQELLTDVKQARNLTKNQNLKQKI